MYELQGLFKLFSFNKDESTIIEKGIKEEDFACSECMLGFEVVILDLGICFVIREVSEFESLAGKFSFNVFVCCLLYV